MDLARPSTAESWHEGAREQQKVNGREIQILQPAQIPWKGESTYAAEFKRWGVQPEKRQSAKKQEAPFSTDAPFEGNSTYRTQFPWRPVTAAPPVSKGPPSRFEPQPHAAPMQSTYAQAFQAMPYAKQASTKPKDEREAKPYVPFVGTSTYNDFFKGHGVQARPASGKVASQTIESLPFEGRSTYAEAYKSYGVQPKSVAQRPKDERERLSTTSLTGTSVYRDTYKDIPLPPGVSYELGVQVVGGRFYHMIARGKRPPCEGKATFTTVVDRQETVEIVVVGRKQDARSRVTKDIELGHFELGGIHPSEVGTPQIVVTYSLTDDMRLRVTALDKQRGASRQMTCKQLR